MVNIEEGTARSTFCSFHSILPRRIDNPRPIFWSATQTRRYGILADVIDFRRPLFASVVVAQTMIKETFLPNDAIPALMKVFPIANHAAHRFITAKCEDRMNMIGHKQKQANVPSLLRFIKARRVKKERPQRRVG